MTESELLNEVDKVLRERVDTIILDRCEFSPTIDFRIDLGHRSWGLEDDDGDSDKAKCSETIQIAHYSVIPAREMFGLQPPFDDEDKIGTRPNLRNWLEGITAALKPGIPPAIISLHRPEWIEHRGSRDLPLKGYFGFVQVKEFLGKGVVCSGQYYRVGFNKDLKSAFANLKCSGRKIRRTEKAADRSCRQQSRPYSKA